MPGIKSTAVVIVMLIGHLPSTRLHPFPATNLDHSLKGHTRTGNQTTNRLPKIHLTMRVLSSLIIVVLRLVGQTEASISFPEEFVKNGFTIYGVSKSHYFAGSGTLPPMPAADTADTRATVPKHPGE